MQMENTYMCQMTMGKGIFGKHYEEDIIKEQINEFFFLQNTKVGVGLLSAYISGIPNNFKMTEHIILFV